MARDHCPLLTLYFILLAGFLPFLFAERSSSQRSPSLEVDAAELIRDGPLYPPLREDSYQHDNSELTEQTNLAYDTESNIEINNIFTTSDEANLNLQNDLTKDVGASLDEIVREENNLDDVDNPVEVDLDDEIAFHNHLKPDDDFFKSSFLKHRDTGQYKFEASRDFDENSEDVSLFATLDSKKLTNNANRVPRETREKNQEEVVDEIVLTDEINKVFPEHVTTVGPSKNIVNNNILVTAEDSEDISENTILMTSDDNSKGEPGILLAPDTGKQIKNSIHLNPEDAKAESLNDKSKIEIISNAKTKMSNMNTRPNQERVKRSQDSDKKTPARRVKTGDTILNIRGAVRDAIGDAGAAPGPRPSSRLDAFVIRPEPAPRPPMRDEPQGDSVQPEPKPVTSQKHERELLVASHSYVRIPCDLVNITNLRWYKDNEAAILSSTLPAAEGTGADGALHIARAARPHSARWRCAGVDSKGRARAGRPTRLLVHEPVRSVYLAVDGRRLDAGNTWVPVRDKTVLEVRCVAEGGVPPPELSWRLLALESALDHRPYLRVYQSNYSIEGVRWSRAVVTAARELHNATLRCSASQRRPPPAATGLSDAPSTPPPAQYDEYTAKLEIHVTYPPSFVISRWPGFGVSLRAGVPAALRCDVDANPPARAFWLRDDDRPASSPDPLEASGPEARGSATLRWDTLKESHAAWYRCRASWLDAEYSSIGYYLNVLSSEDPQAQHEDHSEEPEHQKVDVPLGGNVQLHCPKGSVGCWWRRVLGNASESWAPAGSHHAHGVLGIRGALYQEAGEYRCLGTRGNDLQRLRDLKRVTLRVTGGATATALSATPVTGGWRLECGACGRSVRVMWMRGPRASPGHLTPDIAQHCHRAVIVVPEPDEVWCAAVTANGGAVAVFPRRSSPAPARHAGRAFSTAPLQHPLPLFKAIPITLVTLVAFHTLSFF